MKKNNCFFYYFFTFCIAVIVLISACKSKLFLKDQLKERTTEDIFQKIRENEFQFVTLSLRYAVDLEIEKKNLSFRGNLIIHKDSAIWISINALGGIELFRVLLTNDSLKILNRTQNQYFIGPLKDLYHFFQLTPDLTIIQALLTGNDFAYYDTKAFKVSIDNQQYKLSTYNRRKIQKLGLSVIDTTVYIQDLWINPENFKIVQNHLKEKNQQKIKITCFYSDFESIIDQVLPCFISCNIQANQIISMTISYSKISINKPFHFNFNIPNHYSKMVW